MPIAGLSARRRRRGWIRLVLLVVVLAGCRPGAATPVAVLPACVAMDEIHQARTAIGEGLTMAEANDAAAAAQAGKRASDLGKSAVRRSAPPSSAEVKLLVQVITAVNADLQASARILTDHTSTPSEMVRLTNDTIGMLDEAIAIADEVAVRGRDGSPGACPLLIVPSLSP